MNRLSAALGIFRRRGGWKSVARILVRGNPPYFETRKYKLIDISLRRLKKWGVSGDYFEFGLFRGRAFLSAYELKKKYGLDMHLYGFDSFEGLPAVSGKDASWGVFNSGQYKCSIDDFEGILQEFRVPQHAYTLIPGFYDKSLPDVASEGAIGSKQCALAYIDCDLYESTVPVLEFLNSYLVGGSVIIFDDWFSFAGDPYSGQIRAVREWEEENKRFRLVEYCRSGNQVVFLVQDWNESG